MIYLSGCIGDDIIDDFVEPALRITANVDSLAVGDTNQFDAMYTNNIGLTESITVSWQSSDEGVLSIDETGLATGVGEGTVTARLFGVESMQNGDGNIGDNSTSIFANNTEFLSFSPELNYNFNDQWGFSVGAGYAFRGRIIYANPSYSVGVFFKL